MMTRLLNLARRLRPATWTLFALVVLSCLSVFAAGQSHHGSVRFWMTAVVALLAWIKAQLLLRHYLEVHRAGPVFFKLLQGFAVLAPLGLLLSALREWLVG
ncbi:MAG: hypothetical protein ACM3VZ_06425 [Acidobacteriota bacterium]